ncbi:MAG: PTS sugar transporter subunit IIA [Candidatus Omnitrophota bacterium]|nr:PTS sugar transporter subunit IIA [Candidatus Omnitrophota bacterium]
MLDISAYINSDTIIPDLKAANKEEAIKALVDKLFEGREHTLGKEQVYQEVIKRERLQTTGIGNALAFPHARIEGWGEFAVAMAVVPGGVEFNSLDGKEAKFIFLMISSPNEPYVILQTMSAIIRFLSEMGHDKDMIKDPANIRDILDQIGKRDIKTTEQILARDIARPAVNYVRLETSVEEATRMMHLRRQDILPVVDKDNKFCGDISCCEVFEYGMPHFFRQLNTISFVRHIDPFEKYFRIKKDLKVRDVFQEGTEPIPEDSTLLEVIFEMTVKRRSKLFMVEENGTLSGVIDRFCIIDKILFF